MRHPTPPEPLAHFLELYAARRFRASHEALEEEWSRTSSNFYHGLILYASAWVHWERGNAHGLRAQSIKALQRLDGYPAAYLGLDVDALRAHCIDLRDTVWPGFDAWREVAPMLLAFSPGRVLGTEAELSG
jgi:predicted metal-dependent hydrolase